MNPYLGDHKRITIVSSVNIIDLSCFNQISHLISVEFRSRYFTMVLNTYTHYQIMVEVEWLILGLQ